MTAVMTEPGIDSLDVRASVPCQEERRGLGRRDCTRTDATCNSGRGGKEPGEM